MTDEATETPTDTTNAAANGANSTPAAPVAIADGLRLRMKVWTDPKTGKRYLMPAAFMIDPMLGTMAAHAMTDDDTKMVRLSAVEWNALPFYYFKEDGPAPRTTARPVDVIR